MSKSLKLHYKKVLFAVVAATSLIGGMVPVTDVKAATNVAATTVKSSNAKIVVKGSIITLDAVKSQKESVAESGLPIINADALTDTSVMDLILERKEGIPKKINVVDLDIKGEVTIDNQKYNLAFNASGACKKISNTQVKQQYLVFAKDQTGAEVFLTPDQLKGQKVSITVKKVKYVEDSYSVKTGEIRKEVATDTEANAKTVEWVF